MITDVNGRYVLYFATTAAIGSKHSAIGVATSPSMEPGTWTDHGEVISSKPGDVYNASKHRYDLINVDGSSHSIF